MTSYKFVFIAAFLVWGIAIISYRVFSNKSNEIEYEPDLSAEDRITAPTPASTPSKISESSPAPTPSKAPDSTPPNSSPEAPRMTFYEYLVSQKMDPSEYGLSPVNQVDKKEGRPSSDSKNQSSNSVPDGVMEFYVRWWRSLKSDNPNDIIRHYADVAYYCYANGLTKKQVIYDDYKKLIKDFPTRRYDNSEITSIIVSSPDKVKLQYKFNYFYSGNRKASGSSIVDISIQKIGGQWLITSFSETVDRD